jgi:Zn-dependent protease with chaperone function
MAGRIAEQLNTRPVDAVYITPGTEIAVTEQGGLWRKLAGRGRRCLIVGLGALPGMTRGQLRAILAHEYGHFSNRDTAGGNLAHQVHVSLAQLAYGLATSGLAKWYNPAWLFIQGFYRVFLRVTLGASRLQELLADRYAAVLCGAQEFASGLKQSIHQALYFERAVNGEFAMAQGGERRLNNLYTLPPLQGAKTLQELEAAEAEIMRQATSPYDSHPAPAERIALLEQWQTVDQPTPAPEPAWTLFVDGPALQTEMTDLVQTNVRREHAWIIKEDS